MIPAWMPKPKARAASLADWRGAVYKGVGDIITARPKGKPDGETYRVEIKVDPVGSAQSKLFFDAWFGYKRDAAAMNDYYQNPRPLFILEADSRPGADWLAEKVLDFLKTDHKIIVQAAISTRLKPPPPPPRLAAAIERYKMLEKCRAMRNEGKKAK